MLLYQLILEQQESYLEREQEVHFYVLLPKPEQDLDVNLFLVV